MHYSVNKGDRLEDIPQDINLVTMGINPSKSDVHLGHYLTMYQALRLIADRRDTKGLFFVDDREYDNKKEREGRGVWMPPNDNVASIVVRMRSFIADMERELSSDGLQERVMVRPMSNHMSQAPHAESLGNGYRLYEMIRLNHDRISNAFPIFRPDYPHDKGQLSMRPVCRECHYAPVACSDVQTEPGKMYGACRNAACRCRVVTVDLERDQTNWAMHYTIDPLRDVLLARDKNAGVAHVFGGDYGMEWGPGRTPKAQRLSGLIRDMNKDVVVHHYVGPLLTRYGEKLSKSNGDHSQQPAARELERMLGHATLEVNAVAGH
jgi:hypothetical protein